MALITIVGIWSDGGPELAAWLPNNTAAQVDWPRGQDDSIDLLLVDRDGTPVDLDLTTDSAVLSVRQDLTSDVLASYTATRSAPGSFAFGIASNTTIDFFGLLVYDVWVTRGGAQRQVVAPGYFNVTPRIRTP